MAKLVKRGVNTMKKMVGQGGGNDSATTTRTKQHLQMGFTPYDGESDPSRARRRRGANARLGSLIDDPLGGG